MKFYMSYWSHADTTISEHPNLVRFLTKKSIYFLRKNYKEIHFITDELGKKRFGDLNWTSVSTDLEEFPRKYSSVWSASKLAAFNIISKKGDPFIHLDYDVIITKPFTEKHLNADVLVEFEYNPHNNRIGTPPYDCPEYFLKNCKNIYTEHFAFRKTKSDHSVGFNYFLEPHLNKSAYNCGIIGGTNLNFFKTYAAAALRMLSDKKNKEFWLTDWEIHNVLCKNFNRVSKAVLLEQFYLGLCLSIKGIKPTIFVKDFLDFTPTFDETGQYSDPYNLKYIIQNELLFKSSGYIHFMGASPKAFVLKYLYDYPDKNKLLADLEKKHNPFEIKINNKLIDSMKWIQNAIPWKEEN